jgi:hypothetical protein
MKRFVMLGIVLFSTITVIWAGDGKFGEINLKVGLDFESHIRGHVVWDAMNMDVTEVQPSGIGVSLGAEYLYALPLPKASLLYPGFLKIGAGASYLLPRSGWGGTETDPNTGRTDTEVTDFSLLPFYGIIQVNPSQNFSGLFVRGIIGYTLFLQWDQQPDEGAWGDRGGGLHWGVATGYEFDWGLFVEYAYTQSYFTCDVNGAPLTTDFTYGKSGLAIGYKIRL